MTITAINTTASQVTAKAAKVVAVDWSCSWNDTKATAYIIPGKSITIEATANKMGPQGFVAEHLEESAKSYKQLSRSNHSLAERQEREYLVEQLTLLWLNFADWCEVQGHADLSANIRERIKHDGAEANQMAMAWNTRNTLSEQYTEETVKHYEIGDQAEYDSYNLVYFGEITKITAKSVFIRAYPTDTSQKRLSIEKFVDKNWDDDAPKHARNANWMD